MLQITSTLPLSGATNVLKDATIDITFSKELKSASVSISNFILYLMSGETYVNQVSVGLSKDVNVITMAPVDDLLANRTYETLILGDRNLADAILQGVVATDNDIMSGNYVFRFTTGEMTHIDIEGGASPSDGAVPVGEVIELNILSTSPENLETQVDGLPTIDIEFDRYVTAIDDVDSIEITPRPLVFGMEADLPGVASISYSADHKTITFNISGTITSNTEYAVTVLDDSISGSLAASMDDDYTFRFFTEMHPYYTDPATVRLRGGHLISDTLPDWLINMYILDASIWVSETLNVGFLSGSQITSAITTLTTCKVISNIGWGISEGSLSGIRSKQLADLRIEYDYRGCVQALARFDDCVNRALLSFDAGVYQTDIKSGSSSKYPTKRRVLWYDDAVDAGVEGTQ